jgi:prephenate dehydrogenase
MTYYLLLKGDTEKDAMFETNVLGEESFGVFYPSIGFNIMSRIINDRPELLEDIKILDDHKTSHTITEFLDKLEKWRIKRA